MGDEPMKGNVYIGNKYFRKTAESEGVARRYG